MKLQFESHQDLVDITEELTRSSIVFTVHVRDKFINILKGEIRKDTIECLGKQPRMKISADSD